jgi:hypothetical protein
MEVPVVYKVDDGFNVIIENWLNSDLKYPNIEANNIPETLQFLFDTYND